MKHRILKYPIGFLEKQTIKLPKGAKIERCEVMEGIPAIWALVDEDEKETEDRHIECYKTGAVFTEPVSELVRIGTLTIFIQQELMLYSYERIAKNKRDKVIEASQKEWKRQFGFDMNPPISLGTD